MSWRLSTSPNRTPAFGHREGVAGEQERSPAEPRRCGYAQRTSTVKTWSSSSSEPPLARQPTGFPFSINGLL
jgi:hypothetical protein